MDQMGRIKRRLRTRLLARGESLVASTGLAVATILLLTLGTIGWWTVDAQQQASRQSRQAAAEGVAQLLAQSAEPLLAAGDTAAVRTLVMGAAKLNALSRCRVVLDDGSVIADSDPYLATARLMPERWEPRAAPPARLEPTRGGIAVQVPLTVPNRGGGLVEVASEVPVPLLKLLEAQTNVGLIGAVSLLGLLLVYRQVRARLRGLGIIREALLAMAQGETAAEALMVADDSDPAASAWNKLLQERDALRRDASAGRSRDATGSRRDSRGDLAQACDALWHGLLLIDESLHVRYANGAAGILLRARRETLINAEARAVLGDPKVVEAVRGVIGGGVRTRTAVELRRPQDEGGGVLRFTVRPIRREDAATAVIVIEDVTQQRVADEARNSFVAQATHELRTPLTNIRLYIEEAVDQGEKDPQVRARCLNVISQEARRLERIVGDMLSVAEIEAGSLKLRAAEVRCETIFDELRHDFEAQAVEKHITLAFNLPPKFPVMQGDRDKIVLALHNVIGNAMKYTPDGGKVAVTIETPGDRLVVAVQDSGIGIAPEECELIFEKFYRAKDRRVEKITGTGLGLALAREVVRMHGGDITVQSQPDRGSTFTIILPIRAEAKAA